MDCPCCSGKSYTDCCQLFHIYEKVAPTAEALMRSRYAAFAIPNAIYLMKTTLPAKRKLHNEEELQIWGETNQWEKLEIIATPTPNQVEFKAYYIDEDGKHQVQHESSVFQKINNRWYYVSGRFFNNE